MNTQTFKKIAASTLLAGVVAITGATSSLAESQTSEIELTYVWTAKAGMETQLIQTYNAVGDVLEAGEPGLLKYEISVSEKGDQIIIYERFEDNEALAFHLQGTAAKYFPQISQIATPGPFIFRGDVAEELKGAAYGMNMGAIFSTEWNGFERK
ncbi:MAG: antibiotic biosynthesis monooxygenase [Rhizobiaceae bacterium]|nr:antibiotic biosynthesis monooxygenase [Rhizobiaceae bacterium]